MDALFSEEETLLADSIAAQAAKVVPTTVQDLESFDDTEAWGHLVSGDLLGLGVPDALGGAGSVLDAAIVATALGRVLAPVPYLGAAVLPLHLLVAAGADADATEPVIRGLRRRSVGFTADLTTIAAGGDAAVAWDAAGAGDVLLLGDDRRLVEAPTGPATGGIDPLRHLHAVDGGTATAPVAGTVSAEGWDRWLATALSLVSAELVGVMEGALALAVDHAGARVQFGVPIGSFQAVQHLVADAKVDLEGARAVTHHAAWCVDHRRPAAALHAARVAKAYCSVAGRAVCERVVQVHGGMGMTWDCPAHLFLRRALGDHVLLGDETVHHDHLARA